MYSRMRAVSDDAIDDLKRKTEDHTRAIVTLQVEQKHVVNKLETLEGVITKVTWLIVVAVIGAVLSTVVRAYGG